ncbi:hypothetical protein [Chitinophaga sp. XS-30]|uniref:hypothetical protein n=1 Tax=Chitinophaga sp. XS-30 TaxID=2604421 RepID=UPI0011DC88C9|nr:hypothetical protein [Chitinophaga sp. XS-30]QEH39357.1 hypothetical protein FW415_00100 [Chitinophaga sp. XS-30]
MAMKILGVQRLKSFITFKVLIDFQYLMAHFVKKHKGNQYPTWPTSATRRHLINDYWLHSFIHYGTIVLLASMLIMPFWDSFDRDYFSVRAVVAIALYFLLRFLFINRFIQVVFCQYWKLWLANMNVMRYLGWSGREASLLPGQRLFRTLSEGRA